MRDIKFRAWAKETSYMVYTDIAVCDNKVLFYWPQFSGWGEIDAIPMQFTGLKDRNRKDIYEGDIVARIDEYEKDQIVSKAVVKSKMEFNCGCCKSVFGWEIEGSNSEFYPVEVIGNIYENPEMVGE